MPGFTSVKTQGDGLTSVTSDDIEDGEIVNADIAAGAAIALSKLASDPLARANHTGTQAATTISDFDESVDDRVAALIAPSGLLTESYNDAGDSLGYNVPAAAASDINTGTDTTKALTADALAGSVLGSRTVEAVVFDFATDVATGDGKFFFTVPEELNGMNLIGVHARVITAGSTNSTTIQIHNVTQAADMLSALLEIETGETGSDTSDPGPTIDTANDDVATNDLLRIDVDTVSTTAPQGLIVRLRFQLP